MDLNLWQLELSTFPPGCSNSEPVCPLGRDRPAATQTPPEQQQQSRAQPPSSAVKFKYSPSDNSSSSSASLARTSAGSGTGSRSAIPPLETDLNLCFPPLSPSFLSRLLLEPQKSKVSETESVSHSVRQQRCLLRRPTSSQRQHGTPPSGAFIFKIRAKVADEVILWISSRTINTTIAPIQHLSLSFSFVFSFFCFVLSHQPASVVSYCLYVLLHLCLIYGAFCVVSNDERPFPPG